MCGSEETLLGGVGSGPLVQLCHLAAGQAALGEPCAWAPAPCTCQALSPPPLAGMIHRKGECQGFLAFDQLTSGRGPAAEGQLWMAWFLLWMDVCG